MNELEQKIADSILHEANQSKAEIRSRLIQDYREIVGAAACRAETERRAKEPANS